MNTELETYLDRQECHLLSNHKRELLRRYVRRFGKDMPVGRTLALGMMKLNARYTDAIELVPQSFINWLYTY